MALKHHKPVTPGQRQLVTIKKNELWSGSPEKSLVVGVVKSGGRNHHGRLTSFRKGGGHKRKYRMVDFKRNNSAPATVERIEYDPNRSAFIALIAYDGGEKSYILAPQKISVGDKIISSPDADIKVGNALPLKLIPVGTNVHNVEMKPMKGGQIARAAGSFVQLVGKDAGMALLRLRSGEVRLVSLDCRATIGIVSNPDRQNTTIGKAGRSRWLGKRPVVRGVVMNPVDHPHGGGEGKTSGGRQPVTPWGKPTKGKKTRKNKVSSKFIVKSRHKK